MISITFQELIVWIIIGAFAGMFSGVLLRRKGSRLVNLIIGLVGAVIGGYIFPLFKVPLQFKNISIQVDNINFASLIAKFFFTSISVFGQDD